MRQMMVQSNEKEKGFIEKLFDKIEMKLKKISDEEKKREEGELNDKEEEESKYDEEAKEAYDANCIDSSCK
jgi:hypothetical protein